MGPVPFKQGPHKYPIHRSNVTAHGSLRKNLSQRCQLRLVCKRRAQWHAAALPTTPLLAKKSILHAGLHKTSCSLQRHAQSSPALNAAAMLQCSLSIALQICCASHDLCTVVAASDLASQASRTSFATLRRSTSTCCGCRHRGLPRYGRALHGGGGPLFLWLPGDKRSTHCTVKQTCATPAPWLQVITLQK